MCTRGGGDIWVVVVRRKGKMGKMGFDGAGREKAHGERGGEGNNDTPGYTSANVRQTGNT